MENQPPLTCGAENPRIPNHTILTMVRCLPVLGRWAQKPTAMIGEASSEIYADFVFNAINLKAFAGEYLKAKHTIEMACCKPSIMPGAAHNYHAVALVSRGSPSGFNLPANRLAFATSLAAISVSACSAIVSNSGGTTSKGGITIIAPPAKPV